LAKIFGEKWRALSEKEKEPWKAKAKELKEAGGDAKKKRKTQSAKSKKKPKPVDPENEETASDGDDDDDEDEPLAPKIEDKLKASIDKIMDEADLSELSIRKIKVALKEQYGEEVVMKHKAMIKAHVRSKV